MNIKCHKYTKKDEEKVRDFRNYYQKTKVFGQGGYNVSFDGFHIGGFHTTNGWDDATKYFVMRKWNDKHYVNLKHLNRDSIFTKAEDELEFDTVDEAMEVCLSFMKGTYFRKKKLERIINA